LSTNQRRIRAIRQGEYRGFDTDALESDQRFRCRTGI
jgi:hypothetical protein